MTEERDERDEAIGTPSRGRGMHRRMFLGGLASSAVVAAAGPQAKAAPGDGLTRQMEALDRGLVAVAVDDGVLVRWRLFGTDPDDVAFNLYRDGTRANDSPITDGTNYVDPDGTTDSTYTIRPVVDGTEREESKSVGVWEDNYLDIPLDRPGDNYHPNDASVGDLTGDGSYDIVVKWSPDNAKDNSQSGRTDPHIFDAYTLEGEPLWRIDLGINVRAGAHYAPFLVYDFDGDGIAEFVVRTADGTVDAAGNVIGDPDADWRNDDGYVLDGPEYLTVFDGTTGEELVTTDFRPARGDPCQWGDCYGNRVDRFLAGVAYLDGERPSIVVGRGYYEKTMVTAYDYRDGDLTERWTFDSDEPGNGDYAGQGNHQLGIADLDGDGRDEIVYGAMALDHDGTGLHTTGWHHGDALHCGDFLPDRDGLEIFQPHESGPHGATMRDGETGEPLWTVDAAGDVGRGVAANIDPNHRGVEAWASNGVGLRTTGGERIGDAPWSINHLAWWTGDLQRELVDDWDGPTLHKWDPDSRSTTELEAFPGTRSNNGTKGNPCLTADILGDWREEVIWRRDDDEALRLFVTPYETDHRLYTLMHDSQYRTAIAWQNVGYNQPPHPSFYIGSSMDEPPTPDIEPVGPDGPVDDPTDIIGLPDAANVPADTYRLVNANSGHVLEVAGGDESDGTTVQQGADEDATHQRWDLRYVGEGAYEIVAASSGKALEVAEASTDNGANVRQWTVNGNDNQRWVLDPLDDGAYRLVASHSGLVLGVAGGSVADGANAVQWEWNESDDQRWRLEPVAPRTGGSGPYTVEGAGADIWGSADAFHYYSTSVTGDFDLSVRVDDVENTDEYAKAGLMIRGSMDAGAKNAMIRRTPSATSVQWRPTAGGETVSLTSGAAGESEVAGGTTDHAWQRLVRSGNTVRAYTSADGERWQLLAEFPLSFSSSVRVGLAVTSHASGTRCVATFDELVGIDPSRSDDVGAVDVPGTASGADGKRPPAIDGERPTDPDGDGLYDDVDGDGQTTHADVDAFYDHLETDGVQDNPDAFDFDENGRIGFTDVLELLRQI
ncbi:Regulation of enolase protein 1, concanavalin A-like superfamily [Natrinema salaciae]|uniref:Regulation of enolase protein 1, concanavalin A-like superfamily n=1 Tax=Natrinema salaciae TaxID=1186196 RepID=A0A1H9IF44_9EURY|nr:Regulation of enolase protein 1, concanavalin A-like superfamily [Natrinema salaciae]